MSRALVWLAGVLLLSAATCDKSAQDGSNESTGNQLVSTQPVGDLPDEPSGPGLEPPETTDSGGAGTNMGGAGTAGGSTAGGDNTAGSGSAGAMSGTAGDDMSTSGSAGSTGAVGDGAGQSSPDDDAGVAGCGDLTPCGLAQPCSDPATACIVLPSCAAAYCIAAEEACTRECGQPGCAIAESYPEQLVCD